MTIAELTTTPARPIAPMTASREKCFPWTYIDRITAAMENGTTARTKTASRTDPSMIAITAPIPGGVTNTEALGLVLYTTYIHYFQMAGLVLLVAMIGAIVLTLRHRGYVKRQDINVQNARTKTMAMDVRKVPAGQGLQDSDSGSWIK